MTTSRGRSAIRVGRDRGSADALGAALLAPAAIGLALVILFLGRSVDGRATVQSAAESAAQAAAQERTPAAATRAAREVAAAMLVDATSCSNPAVSVDTSAFVPGGQVAVTVSCSVSAAGLELIDPPASTASATAFATIDPFRAAGDAP
ncbi:MAG: pilus assembly protein [Ilumatobacteraceae bacterium]